MATQRRFAVIDESLHLVHRFRYAPLDQKLGDCFIEEPDVGPLIDLSRMFEMPTELAKVNDRDSAAEYLRRHGGLGYSQMEYERTQSVVLGEPNYEPLPFLLGQAATVRSVLNLYAAMHDEPALRQRLDSIFEADPHHGGFPKPERAWTFSFLTRTSPLPLNESLMTKHPDEVARQVIQRVVNENLREGIRASVDVTDGQFTFNTLPATPLAAVWWHVGQLVASGGTLANCAASDCGHLFWRRDHRSRYCPRFGKRSKCEERSARRTRRAAERKADDT